MSGYHHHVANCGECPFAVDSVNAMAVAAKHHYKTGHHVTVELGYSYSK